MSRALIFDCDGVLADTERDGHLVAFNRLFAELGLDLQWSLEQYARLLRIAGGKERLRSLFADPEWVAHHGLPVGREGQEALVASWHRRKTRIFRALVAEGRLPARPGVARLAGEACGSGWHVAVASTASEPSVRAIVEHVFPAELAAAARVFAGDVVPRKKPAPDIYRLALGALGSRPREACVVEDSHQGLAAARSAGCAAIITVSALTAGEDFSGAALVVDSLGEHDRPMRILGGTLRRMRASMVNLAVVEAVVEEALGRPG